MSAETYHHLREPTAQDLQRETDRVNAVGTILLGSFGFSGFDQTQHNSQDDLNGVDMILFPGIRLTKLIDMPVVRVQIKKSEAEVQHFFDQGRSINGPVGLYWQHKHLTVLDVSLSQKFILADFTVQLMNLMGIYGDEKRMSEFMKYMNPEVRKSFYDHQCQELIRCYRSEMLDWVAGRSNGNRIADPVPKMTTAR